MNLFNYLKTMRERRDRLSYLRTLRPYTNAYYLLHIWYVNPVTNCQMELEREYLVSRKIQRDHKAVGMNGDPRTIVGGAAERHIGKRAAYHDVGGVVRIITPIHIWAEPISRSEFLRRVGA